MPTYKNSSGTDITVEGVRIPAKSSVQIDKFLNTLPANISKTSDSPQYSPALATKKMSGNDGQVDSLAIPALEGGCIIDVQCGAGELEVRLNSASNDPAFKLFAGQREKIRILERIATAVHITFKASSSTAIVNLLK